MCGSGLRDGGRGTARRAERRGSTLRTMEAAEGRGEEEGERRNGSGRGYLWNSAFKICFYVIFLFYSVAALQGLLIVVLMLAVTVTGSLKFFVSVVK